MLTAGTANRPRVDTRSRSLRVGPLLLHASDSEIDNIGGDFTLKPPFSHAWFMPACGYLTWQTLATAFGLNLWTGYTWVSGNEITYGCWIDADPEAARVLARLAGQTVLIEWTDCEIRMCTGDPDGPTAKIDLTASTASSPVQSGRREQVPDDLDPPTSLIDPSPRSGCPSTSSTMTGTAPTSIESSWRLKWRRTFRGS